MASTSEDPEVTWHLEKHGVGCRGGQGGADQEPRSHGLGSSPGCRLSSVGGLARASRPRGQRGDHCLCVGSTEVLTQESERGEPAPGWGGPGTIPLIPLLKWVHYFHCLPSTNAFTKQTEAQVL